MVFNLDLTTILPIIAIQLLYYPLQAYLFRIVLEKCSGSKLPFFGWFKIFILSTFLNTVFSQTGNVYRGLQLKSDYNISYTRYISSYISFAWMDLWINLIIATAIILLLKPDLHIGPLIAWKVLLAAIIVVIAVPILIEILCHRIKFNNARLSWIHSKLSEVLTVSVNNITDTAYLSKITLINIVVLICIAGLFRFCFLILGIKLNIPTVVIFYALLKIGNYVNITPGNLGIQELAYGFLGTQMGIGMAQSILVSAFMRLTGTAVLVLLAVTLGGISLLWHRKYYTNTTTQPFKSWPSSD